MSHLLWDMKKEFSSIAGEVLLPRKSEMSMFWDNKLLSYLHHVMNLGGIKTHTSYTLEAKPCGGSLEWRHLPIFLLVVKNK